MAQSMASDAADLKPIKYKLSQELRGHTDVVRNVAIFKDGSIVSASRDRTARFWKCKDGKYEEESIVMKGHNDFVCSICTIEPTKKNSAGFIITGSKDKNINIYHAGQEEPIHTVKAHNNVVCHLKASVIENGLFFSCSSDNTGKLWNLHDLGKPLALYLGHAEPTNVIWCITDLPNGIVVTGGSDKLVIVYSRDGKMLHQLNGHMDSVRDIVEVGDSEFLSCSNDGVTKHWNAINGNCLGTYKEHTSQIYSISALLGGGLAVTCGEDWSIQVWRNGKIDQSIAMPVQTIWSTKLLSNEDIVCGSSDGIVRVFTIDPERYIDKEVLKEFERISFERYEKYLKNSKHRNHEADNDALITKELQQPGEKDGDTVIVKDHTGKKAGRMYKWNQAKYQWILFGDVVQSEKTSGRPVYNGVEYDYVFSVDIDEDNPYLKLPYNRGENPYIVAKKFLEDNNLDERYLLRVAQFIETNLQLKPILNAEAQYNDPFTGGSRYISQPSTSSSSSTAHSSRMSPPPNSLAAASYIPQTNYLKFDQGNIYSIQHKLKEFNDKTEDEVQCISDDKLVSLMKLVNSENISSIGEEMNDLKTLLNWPDNILFPVLDIARLAVLQQSVNEEFCTNGILEILKRHVQNGAIPSNQMLTFRLLANLFHHEAGERFCLKCKDVVLTSIRELTELGNKSNQTAISTYILNLVIALNKQNDSAGKKQTLDVILRLIGNLKETEAVFRTLIALGTLILKASSDNEREEFVTAVKQSRPVLTALKILLDGVDSSNVPNKLLSVTRHILQLIRNNIAKK